MKFWLFVKDSMALLKIAVMAVRRKETHKIHLTSSRLSGKKIKLCKT
jgi:hypothetical protein